MIYRCNFIIIIIFRLLYVLIKKIRNILANMLRSVLISERIRLLLCGILRDLSG